MHTKTPATVGISPKAVLAAVLPALAGLTAIGVQWVATGELDRNEAATALGTVAASLLAFLGGYLGQPGNVTTGTVTGPAPVVTSSSGAGAVTFTSPRPGVEGEFSKVISKEIPGGSVPAEGGQ